MPTELPRTCENCAHRKQDPLVRCTHPSVRLVGIRVLLDERGTCEDHQFPSEFKEGDQWKSAS